MVTYGTNYAAFVTNPRGQIDNLNSLVSLPDRSILTQALGINDSGQIIATGSDYHAYLLSPIPEPESYALMLFGLVVVGLSARRKKQSSQANPA